MKTSFILSVGVALALGGPHDARAADEPLSACFDAVGTFLTTNTDVDTKQIASRSLFSFTNGGHFFRSDSVEGGGTGFAPFSGTRGDWRCVSDDGGKLHMVALGIDFSQKTTELPDQTMARVELDATYDEESDSLEGEFSFYLVPIDADPMDTSLRRGVRNFTFDSIRVTAPM